jgi:ribulose-phosphate 3-epimerase
MVLINKITSAITAKDTVFIVGIDGPTASGKTYLANNLKTELEAQGKKVIIFRLDWALKNRKDRLMDLEYLKKRGFSFENEAELHMDLGIVKNFLEHVARFKQRSLDTAKVESKVRLTGLYSREENGELKGKEEFELTDGMVIILDGHYTLRSELDKYIDQNILLLAGQEELLKRKIDRVKEYRSVADAKDYFYRIDIPSFRNHLNRFGANADLIIDNTDYLDPKHADRLYLKSWMTKEDKEILPSIKFDENLSEFIFSESMLVKQEHKECTSKAVAMLRKWDSRVGHYIRTSIGSLSSDLTKIAKEFIKELNEDSSEDYTFNIMHTDALYNVYNRVLPLSLSVGLFYKDSINPVVSIVAEVFQSELTIQIVWEGGYRKISLLRELGEITTKEKFELKDTTGEFSMADSIEVMSPTSFTVPKFLDGMEYKLIFIKKEDEVISASQALSRLLHKGGVWIHRFALFSELRFYKDILRKSGAMSVQIGNYLISVKHGNLELRERFKEFVREWETPQCRKDIFKRSQDEFDKIVIDERDDAKSFVAGLKHFIMMDGYLFSRFMYEEKEKIDEAMQELRSMMLSKNRLLRKRANQFLQKFFPVLNLKTAELWDDLPLGSSRGISLENYNRINPSIMAEVFLWQVIRDDKTSILATNIYDIRDESIDSYAFLEAALEESTAIILQSSLNAAGQLEYDDSGRPSVGYLKIDKGPRKFIEAATRAARDLYLKKGALPPLFGIGLDHVAAKQDIPKGRAQRFFKLAYETGKLTHYVQDGSCLFDAKTRSDGDLISAYDKMVAFSVDLVDDLKATYLLDREICAGELNYVENSDQALIPSVYEMRLFIRTYEKALEEKGHLSLLARPMLFIGNLGTTHHSVDKTRPKVETAKVWRDNLKNENFISPVLHGTTNSHRDVLRDAAAGCSKINVAGDLLNVFVSNLPEHISRIITGSDMEPKRMLSSINHLLDKLSYEEKQQLLSALSILCRDLIKTINSPRLTEMDSNYFQYNTYAYPSAHIDVILKALQESIEKYRVSAVVKEKKNYHFAASMIEVPEEDMFSMTDTLWKAGIRYFHIDAGDGKFITREFLGIKKAKFVREHYPEAILHAHLMVKNPHIPRDGNLSILQQYIDAGCDAVAVHPRAFDSEEDLIDSLKLIKNLGRRPGILIETHDTFSDKIRKIIEEVGLDWVIIMGVPIGYGGQMFQFTTLQQISTFQEYFKEKNRRALVEADGGLTFQTLRLCKNAGAELFSGWSIIKSADLEGLKKNIKQVYDIFNER